MKSNSLTALATVIAVSIMLILSGAGSLPFSLPLAVIMLSAGTGLMFLTNRGSDFLRIPTPVTSLILLILLLAVTAVPLPGIMGKISGKSRVRQNALVDDTLVQASELGIVEADSGTSRAFSLTRNRSGTIKIILLFIGMFCSAVLSASLATDFKKFYACFLVTVMALLAVTGFLHQWVWQKPKTLLWFIEVEHGTPLGCFMNRTNHGGYLAMLLPVSLHMYVMGAERKSFSRMIVFGIASAVTTVAIFATLSRGAVVVATAGSIAILLFTVISTRHDTRPRAVRALLGLWFAMIAICLIIPSSGIRNTVSERMATLLRPLETDSARARISLWKDSVKIWKDYPIIGIGANAFRMVYPQYRSRDDRKLFYSPENEYVQMLTDTGLLGTLLALFCASSLAVFCAKRSLLYSPYQKEIRWALLSSVMVVLLHNAVDFPLHTPLYAFTFSSIIGLLWPFYSEPADQCPSCGERQRLISGTGLISLSIILTLSLAVSGTAPCRRDSSDHILRADAEELATSLVWAPTSWQAWYHFGRISCMKGTRDALSLGIACINQALEYDPKNYRMWYQLGLVKLNAGDRSGADRAFERANSLRSWLKAPGINTEKL